ncbi:MAG: hypothetical protein M1817_006880 [Caeruleum heppii]|nr:MAG: hypothetical protein M1817_006880 [Caeruleum heppii]
MDPTQKARRGISRAPGRLTPPVHRRALSETHREGSRESQDDDGTRPSRVAHTLTACERCRKRKTRCDTLLPRCGPCAKNNYACRYLDPTKGKLIPRAYVVELQDKVRDLEAQLAGLDAQIDDTPDAENMIRGAGMVRFDEGIEPRYLGSSSGIAMTRLNLEQAKHYNRIKTIHEILPDVKNRPRPDPANPADPGQAKSYPTLSYGPASSLPLRSVADGLVEVYCQKSQFLLPTLHEPTFRKEVDAVYDGSKDPYQNFVLKMVFAISLQKISMQYAGLADSYYLAAFAHLEAVVSPMDLRTLQCLVLVGQYSLLTPTRTAVYYVIGLATRLCQSLGLHEEKTIASGGSESAYNPLERDMRRRLFWIVTSMEFGLSHTLGRPSAMAVGPKHIDVGLFEHYDDEYITAEGILPGPLSPKKLIAIHFFKMRHLQAEIRRKLYQKKREEPQDDQHPWFAAMEAKVDHWMSSSPYNAEGSGHSHAWFTSKYNTIIVMLFRPSPQIPRPSLRAAIRCFDASAFNVRMQSKQMTEGSVDISWIFVQSVFMAVNTLLWSISYAEIRRLHTKIELEELLAAALKTIVHCSERWPGAAVAAELYRSLADATYKAYETDSDAPRSTVSPSSVASPSSYFADSTRSSVSTPPGGVGAYDRPIPNPLDEVNVGAMTFRQPKLNPTTQPVPYPQALDPAPVGPYGNYQATAPMQGNPFSPLPSEFVPMNAWGSLSPSSPYGPGATLSEGPNFPALSLATSDQYLQSTLPPLVDGYPASVDVLSPEQHQELMVTLENDGMADIDMILDQSANFFRALGTP